MKTLVAVLALLFFNENAFARSILFANSYSVPSSLYKRQALQKDRYFHEIKSWITRYSKCVLTAKHLMFEKIIPEYETYQISENSIELKSLGARSYNLVFEASAPFRPFAKPAFAPRIKVVCRLLLWDHLSQDDAFRSLSAVMPVLIQN